MALSYYLWTINYCNIRTFELCARQHHCHLIGMIHGRKPVKQNKIIVSIAKAHFTL